MSEIVVDTSSWILYFSQGTHENLIEPFLEKSAVVMPSLVVAEILSGKMSDTKRKEMIDFLASFEVHGRDFAHWKDVGLLRSFLARKGITISTPDCHIAQVCLETKAALLSEDKIFAKIAPILSIATVEN